METFYRQWELVPTINPVEACPHYHTILNIMYVHKHLYTLRVLEASPIKNEQFFKYTKH